MFIFETETVPLRSLALMRPDSNPARILWCVRRLALMAPLESARCQVVHIALQRDFGDCGMGIEHLLRCLLVGLSRCASRRLAIATPGCALLTSDEAALLALIAAPSSSALVALAGEGSASLLPLCEALCRLTSESDQQTS